MLTVAIHSPNNPDILIAMRDALVLCGVKEEKEWNDSVVTNELNELKSIETFLPNRKSQEDEGFLLLSIMENDKDAVVNLTRENFGDVLNFVLLCQIWEEN